MVGSLNPINTLPYLHEFVFLRVVDPHAIDSIKVDPRRPVYNLPVSDHPPLTPLWLLDRRVPEDLRPYWGWLTLLAFLIEPKNPSILVLPTTADRDLKKGAIPEAGSPHNALNRYLQLAVELFVEPVRDGLNPSCDDLGGHRFHQLWGNPCMREEPVVNGKGSGKAMPVLLKLLSECGLLVPTVGSPGALGEVRQVMISPKMQGVGGKQEFKTGQLLVKGEPLPAINQVTQGDMQRSGMVGKKGLCRRDIAVYVTDDNCHTPPLSV